MAAQRMFPLRWLSAAIFPMPVASSRAAAVDHPLDYALDEPTPTDDTTCRHKETE